MTEYTRRATDALESNTLKANIYEAMGSVEGADTRVMLTMMARMIDVQERAHSDMISLIDRRFTDVAAMQKLVLNGTADTHHEDHEYIKEVKNMMHGFEPALKLASERMKFGGYCDYADRMMREEVRLKEIAEREAQEARSKRAALKYDIAQKLAWAVGAILIYALLPDVWKTLQAVLL
jgi:hypothetical protein